MPDAVGWFAQKLEELGVGDDDEPVGIHESKCDGISKLPSMAWLPWSLDHSDSCVLSAWLGNYVSREEQQREREARSPHYLAPISPASAHGLVWTDMFTHSLTHLPHLPNMATQAREARERGARSLRMLELCAGSAKLTTFFRRKVRRPAAACAGVLSYRRGPRSCLEGCSHSLTHSLDHLPNMATHSLTFLIWQLRLSPSTPDRK